jgi:hypothetical protein
MTVLSSGNTVYTHPVAKVMISIPDQLLERLDAYTRINGETRSGLLQRLAEQELEVSHQRRREELERLLGPPVPMGGEGARLIREDRESH